MNGFEVVFNCVFCGVIWVCVLVDCVVVGVVKSGLFFVSLVGWLQSKVVEWVYGVLSFLSK